GVAWRGIIDRLERTDKGLRIVDLKTSTSAPSEADAARSLQLAFYAIALRDAGEDVFEAQLWYPATKPKKPSVRRLDMSALDERRAEIERIGAGITSEEWEARLSAKDCEYCAFKATCPHWPEGRGVYLP